MQNQYILSICDGDQICYTIPELEECIVSRLESPLDLKNLLLTNKHYFQLINNCIKYQDFRSFFGDAGENCQLIKYREYRRIQHFQKMLDKFSPSSSTNTKSNDDMISIYRSFDLACNKNHLHVVGYLMKKYSDKLKWNEISAAFKSACKNGCLEICQFLYRSHFHKNFKTKNFDDEIIFSCCDGYLNLAKWLYSLNKDGCIIDIHAKRDKPFYYAATQNQIPIAKWIVSITKINSKALIHQIFCEVCDCGYLEMAKLIFSLGDKPDLHYNNDAIFRYACFNGNINTIKFLLSLDGNINIHTLNDEPFRHSCQYGKLNIAKLLYQTSLDNNHAIDVHILNDYVFKNSCINGHLEVAQWLYSLDANMNVNWKKILFFSCERNRIKFVKWIYDLNINIDIHRQKEKIFRTCCRLGHFNLVKYLYSKNAGKNSVINIHADCEYAFRLSCQNGHFKIAKWLYEISRTNGILINIRAKNDQAFRCSCECNRIEVAKWLTTLHTGYRIGNKNKRSLNYEIIH